MRVLVDASSVTTGGLATYVSGLTGGWVQQWPDDELHVLAPRAAAPLVPPAARHVVAHGGRSPLDLVRRASQTGRTARAVSADVVLCTLPLVPLRPGPPAVAVVHDLLGELLPGQLTWQRRAARRALYGHAYRSASRLVAVSHRTRADLVALHAGTCDRVVVVPHGCDHAERWRPLRQPGGAALTTAHFAHKDPSLAVRTWERVLAARPTAPDLDVVGLSAAERERLAGLVGRSPVLEGRVHLLPRLSDEDFGRRLASAAVLLFPSRFEGFGLPALEAMLLGVPVVIGPEPALLEVCAGHAHASGDFSAEGLARAVLTALDVGAPAEATDHARRFTWGRTASATRAVLCSALGL